MKNILCYGDSNTWGAQPVLKLGSPNRYPLEVRWTTVMQNQLGSDYHVIAEGLNGRTSAFDDEIEGAGQVSGGPAFHFYVGGKHYNDLNISGGDLELLEKQLLNIIEKVSIHK